QEDERGSAVAGPGGEIPRELAEARSDGGGGHGASFRHDVSLQRNVTLLRYPVNHGPTQAARRHHSGSAARRGGEPGRAGWGRRALREGSRRRNRDHHPRGLQHLRLERRPVGRAGEAIVRHAARRHRRAPPREGPRPRSGPGRAHGVPADGRRTPVALPYRLPAGGARRRTGTRRRRRRTRRLRAADRTRPAARRRRSPRRTRRTSGDPRVQRHVLRNGSDGAAEPNATWTRSPTSLVRSDPDAHQWIPRTRRATWLAIGRRVPLAAAAVRLAGRRGDVSRILVTRTSTKRT